MLTEQTLYRTRPDVSIDGKRFIYSSTRGAADQFINLYVQPVAGGEPYKLTFFRSRCLSSALVAGRRMDRLHLQPGRSAAAGAARDLWRRAEADRRIDRPALEAPDGHAVGPRHD